MSRRLLFPPRSPRMSKLRLATITVLITNTAIAYAQVVPPPTAPPAQQPTTGADPAAQAPAGRRGPRPYAQVITARAHTERGGITIHKVDDRFFFELPDS